MNRDRAHVTARPFPPLRPRRAQATRAISGLRFDTGPVEPPTFFAVVTVLIGAVALTAGSPRAPRGASVDLSSSACALSESGVEGPGKRIRLANGT